MRNKKFYKENDPLKSFNRRLWIYSAIFFVIWLGLLFYLNSPKTLEFRNSTIGTILRCALVALPCLLVAFLKINQMPWLGKLVFIGFCVLYTLFSFVSLGRYTLLFFYFYTIISIVIAIILYVKAKTDFASIYCLAAFSFLNACFVILDLKTVKAFPFLLPTIISTAVLTIISIFIAIKMHQTKPSVQNLIFIPLSTLFITFIAVWMSLTLFNFVFDNSLPSFETYEIIEKDIASGARSPTTYDLTVKNDEREFEISVSETSYYSLSVGDQIIITFYEGALKEAYYVYEPSKNQE